MSKEKTWKQCYQAHERRMWVTGVILPLIGTAATVASNPQACDFMARSYVSAKNKVQSTVNNIRDKIEQKKQEKKG